MYTLYEIFLVKVARLGTSRYHLMDLQVIIFEPLFHKPRYWYKLLVINTKFHFPQEKLKNCVYRKIGRSFRAKTWSEFKHGIIN